MRILKTWLQNAALNRADRIIADQAARIKQLEKQVASIYLERAQQTDSRFPPGHPAYIASIDG